MKIYGLDIETIPNQQIPASCVPVFDPAEVKFGNTKDPEKRAIKEAAERAKFDEGLIKKMSLDPAFCQLCTFVGILVDTDDSKIISETVVNVTDDDPDGISDFEAVTEAWAAITAAYQARLPIVTFNGTSFDFPVLQMRAILQDVPVDPAMYHHLTPKYGGRHHYDLMQILANYDRQRWRSFDFYIRLFGIGNKSNFDGSMVYDAWKAGEFDKIKTYCRIEVIQMCKLFEEVERWIKIDVAGG